MSDLLTLLDQAIDGLASDVSSRCSRSQVHGEGLTGTPTLLETKTVPAVPVVPGEKPKVHGSDAPMSEDTCHGSSSSIRVAHTSTIQNRTGTAGTTGTDPENQRTTVPKTSLETGNNGNNPKRPPFVLLDGYMRVALQRPPSWADPTALPSSGCFCSCCKGRRWWREREAPKGWRCSPVQDERRLPRPPFGCPAAAHGSAPIVRLTGSPKFPRAGEVG
jgi:hypothetical protein